MGRKGHNKDKDLGEIQELKQQNRELRRTVSALRKQLDRVDITGNEHLQAIIDRHDEQEEKQVRRKERDKSLSRWVCKDCGRGFLILVVLSRPDGEVYLRKCDCCGKRTKLQKWKEGVTGLSEGDVTDHDRERLLK